MAKMAKDTVNSKPRIPFEPQESRLENKSPNLKTKIPS